MSNYTCPDCGNPVIDKGWNDCYCHNCEDKNCFRLTTRLLDIVLAKKDKCLFLGFLKNKYRKPVFDIVRCYFTKPIEDRLYKDFNILFKYNGNQFELLTEQEVDDLFLTLKSYFIKFKKEKERNGK